MYTDFAVYTALSHSSSVFIFKQNIIKSLKCFYFIREDGLSFSKIIKLSKFHVISPQDSNICD